MRIALSNSTRIWGGAEIVTEMLVRGLRARGHEVVLLCRPGSPFLERLGGEIPCERVPAGFDLNPVSVGRSVLALRKHRPQVVMTMTQKDPRVTGPAARLLGIPVVVRHPMDVPLRPRLRHRLFYGWIPAHSVANSRATRDTIVRSVEWLDQSDVTVIHNGIDVERIASAAPADLGLPAGAVAVGFVGRLDSRKGARELAGAWPRIAEEIPEAHLVLVGRGGDLEGEIRERLRGVPRVHWLGFRGDVPGIMHALDLLVLPSHREGFGLVVTEAMAAGTPVVAARASNFPELIDDGAEGRLFEVGNAGALAEAVIGLARFPEVRERMGRTGRARVARDFSVERMLDEYEALFTRIVAECGT